MASSKFCPPVDFTSSQFPAYEKWKSLRIQSECNIIRTGKTPNRTLSTHCWLQFCNEVINLHWVKIFQFFFANLLEIAKVQLNSSKYDVLLSPWKSAVKEFLFLPNIYLFKLKSTKKTLVQSVRPQRHIQNVIKHIRWSFFAKILSSFQILTIVASFQLLLLTNSFQLFFIACTILYGCVFRTQSNI